MNESIENSVQGQPRRPRVKIALQTTVAGSLHTFFRGQLTWLKNHDFEVHTVSAPGEELKWVAEAEQVSMHAVPMTRSFSPFRDPLALWRLVRLYHKSRFTVVHSFTPKGGLLGMLAAVAAGCPVRLFTLWGMAPTAINTRTRLRVWANKVSCALAHKVFIECPSTAELAVASRLCPREKVCVVPAWSTCSLNGKMTDLSDLPQTRAAARTDWNLPSQAVVIGFVGRVVRDKGVHELIEAFEKLASEFPNLHLLIVGVREVEDPVGENILRRIDHHERIRCTGFQKDVRRLLSAMDILVHPSYREGLPTAPLEAAARGLPVVATRIPGCVDAVQDGRSGLLVPPQDSEALAEAIRYYLKNPDVRQQHGRNGREWILQKYDRQAAWTALLNEYQKLLAERGIFPLPARDGEAQR
ncbi:MAG: glycosyltransferase family 4 protein [Verrucomicrobiota bacterium]